MQELNLETLAREELTDAEVREVLERLGAEQMGGSERPTVGAVAEATGTGPEVIGRILGEIRKRDLEARFGTAIDRHEVEIKRLDQQTARLARERAKIYPQDDEVTEEIERIARERIAQRKLAPLSAVAVAFIVIVAIGLAGRNGSGSGYSAPSEYSMTTKKGVELHLNSNGETWAIGPDGTRRPVREDEQQDMSTLYIMSSSDKR